MRARKPVVYSRRKEGGTPVARRALSFIWVAALLAAAPCLSAENSADATPSIVPRPAEMKLMQGSFLLSAETRLVAADESSRAIARLFADYLLSQHGLRLRTVGAPVKSHNYISFSGQDTHGLPEEGYRLAIEHGHVTISGKNAGLFYGMQTLTQLLPAEIKPALALPALEIADHPRFGYRGLLLDVGRHYFSPATIKKYLDLAAQYKINRFHWHLTDDQGWRVEIKKYPKLTAVGSYVDPTSPGGRYYTQEQIQDILDYAHARFITVIPEIEMPGHAGAAIAAYPELACAQSGSENNVLCPSESTFEFLRNVLAEVAALFPSPYIHIGSDEVDKQWWHRSPESQAIMKNQGLKNEEELQGYFVRRMEQTLGALGKRTIGWDEILEGGLAPNAIVMSWRGEAGGIQAVKQGHEAIMTPSEYCYFDYYQGEARREPEAIGGFVPLEKAYSYDPVPQALKGAAATKILGAQASVWTEYITTTEHLEYMTFPRLLAFSEAVWSPGARKDYTDFKHRLPYHLVRLDKQDVRFRLPEPDGLADFYSTTEDHAVVKLNSLLPGSQIYYTLDGSDPGTTSARYGLPFEIPLRRDQKSQLNLIVVSPTGRRSAVYGASFLRRDYVAARAIAAPKSQIVFIIFDGEFARVQDLEHATAAATGSTGTLDLKQFARASNYGVRFDGYMNVESDDYYRFAVESDDGAVLEIDDEVVIDNDGNHPPRRLEGHIPLRRGFHKITLRYFQAAGGASLDVRWAASGAELKPLEAPTLFRSDERH